MKETIALFKTKKMMRLSLLFWYTGFNQPYQLVTYGDRFFFDNTLGLLFALFYSMEIFGAYAVGRLLDDKSVLLLTRSRRCLIVFLFTTLVGCGVALYMELVQSSYEGT